MAPILPFMAEAVVPDIVVAGEVPNVPDSVHLTSWPTEELAALRDPALEASMGVATRVVDLVRTLRGQAGIKVRQPLSRMWLAMPGPDRLVERDALLALVADEVNVKSIELIGDESELVDRRSSHCCPRSARSWDRRSRR